MSVFETTSTSSRGRRFSTWSNQFCPGQPHRYIAENDLLPVRPGQTKKDAFIHAGDDILSPPCFNWRPLELFLQRARLGDLTRNASGQASTLDLTGQRPCPRLSSMCLIDDRSSSSCQSEIPAHPQFEQQLDSKDGDYIHGSCLPQLGGTAFRKNLNEQELYHRLLEKRSDIHADRRVLLITNLTPLCAVALAATVAHRFAAELKVFLQAHLLGEIYFFANTQSPNPPSWDSTQERLHAEPTFSLGFHLSYVALREGAMHSDPRGVRQPYSMIKPMGDSSADELFYYDAQISFLITGVDEGQWTAYCIIDTFMGSNEDTEAYLLQKADGPSGGARKESQPCWNPREYFLIVLSQRIKQITREWGNVTSTLMERLDAYESHYIRIINRGDLRDNVNMTQTRSYMKAVSILHQLHDTLFAQLASLQTFLDNEIPYFETRDKDLDEQWRYYFDRISREMVHLRRWERRLMQRMQRFDGMKDGLIGSSTLLESRRSTKQGDDIGVLTNMTVAYLPFNLAATIFSISTDMPRGLIWVYWSVASVILGLVTFYFAFWGGVKNSLFKRERQGGKQ